MNNIVNFAFIISSLRRWIGERQKKSSCLNKNLFTYIRET